MEEWVGQLWDKMVTRAARRDYPEAAVSLDDIRQPVALMFRALGGEGGCAWKQPLKPNTVRAGL